MRPRRFFHFIPVIALMFSLLGSVAKVTSVRADIPAGLSALDWKQIQALLTPTQQAYLKASNTWDSDYFGYSVAVYGDTVVVGAPDESSNATGVNGNQMDNSASASGAVYVFIRSGNNWSQQAYLKASNTGALDYFGYSVAISDDTLIVGAYGEDSNATNINGNQVDNSAPSSGAAYVFTRNGGTWGQQAYLKASNTGTSDGFGHSVAISGDTIAVGAYNEDSNATGVNGIQTDNSSSNSGAAYVFTRSGGTWSQQAYLKASNTGASDFFGYSVAISGDTVVVGAELESSNATGVDGNQLDNSALSSGAAYVFTRNGTTWSQQAYLKASNSETNDNFGKTVAISGDTVVVGAHREDSSASGVNGIETDNSSSGSGAAYIFIRSGSSWSQQAYLKASNTGTDDRFGTSIAASGDTVVVGAWSEDSNAAGVNGNQTDNTASNSGAVYVFTRSGSDWSQQAYLKASNSEAGDNFGETVAISGDTVVVGAYKEDSNATGVNGNEGNNSFDAGAAYVFAISSTASHTVTFKANGGSGSMISQVASSPTALNANTFTRTGYSFSGWNTAANGSGTSYANGAIYNFTADITLYAQWTALPNTFFDVPLDYWAWQYIESLYNSGITGGCGNGNYCPTSPVTRAQMAVFLLKGIHGPSYASPTVNGSTGFSDVAVDYWAAAWIKQLAAEGITGGCGSGNYCPESTVTRDQMAVFLLKAKYGSSYAPPAVNGSTGFTDVPADYWAAAWIKQLAAEAITGGCGGSLYCPSNPVTRDQMAVFLQKTFNLPLP